MDAMENAGVVFPTHASSNGGTAFKAKIVDEIPRDDASPSLFVPAVIRPELSGRKPKVANARFDDFFGCDDPASAIDSRDRPDGLVVNVPSEDLPSYRSLHPLDGEPARFALRVQEPLNRERPFGRNPLKRLGVCVAA